MNIPLKRLSALLAAGVATSLLAACGSSDSDASSGEFSFKDDLGETIKLDEMPDRLLVQSSMAAALTDLGLGDKIVGTFGPTKNADGEPDSQVGGQTFDVKDVSDTAEYGNIKLEEAASLKPDLVVTSSYLGDDLWYINDKTAASIKKRFPILTVSFEDKTLPEMLDSTERAAEALGADLDSAEVKDAHEKFETAAASVKSAAEGFGDKKIVAGSYSPDNYYVSNPEISPDLTYWKDELGVPITVPDNPDPQGYFETLSWEKADKYPADVFLWDDRIGAAGLTAFKKEKVFATLNAVKDDAFIPWTSVFPPSYEAAANNLDILATNLTKYSS